jgi:hypothetical protein
MQKVFIIHEEHLIDPVENIIRCVIEYQPRQAI